MPAPVLPPPLSDPLRIHTMTATFMRSFSPTPLCSALTLALLPLAASAQVQPDAGRALESLQQQRPTLPAPAPIELRLPETPGAGGADSGGTPVQVQRFAVEGNSVIATDELQALLAPLQGQSLTLAQLQGGAARVTQLYRERGYPFAYAYLPEQTVEGGLVRVAVLEGRLGTVRIDNASRQREAVVATPLERLQRGAVMRADALEESLLLLGDVAGVKAQASLQPGVEPGTSDLVVKAEDTPLASGAISADNYGNRYTGAYRASGNVQLNGALGMGEQIDLQTVLSNEQLRNYRLGYQMPVGPWNTRVGASLSHLDYELGEQFEALDAYGSAKVASLYAIQPLVRSRRVNLNARLQYDQKRLVDHVGATKTDERKRSNLTTLGLDGNWQDGIGGAAVNQWSLGWVHGRLRLGSDGQQARDAATARSAGSFQVLTASIARWQALSGPWSLHARANGQVSNSNLDSSEKMSLGGAYGVRAYPQGEASGDEGVQGTVELRYALAAGWQLSGFVDGGRVKLQHSPWAAGRNFRSLGGAGFGVQRTGADWSIETALAWRVDSGAARSAPDKSPRLWVKAQKYF